jgi:RimJ/RimL family protein N-acetyltransferase
VTESLALRPARGDDSHRVWEWNFAPDVRLQSLDARAVGFDEHDRWWTKRLAADPACTATWIVELDGSPVGVVRIDPIEDAGGDRISIALAPTMRRRGIGRRAIALACRRWARPIVAEIVDGNVASTTAFASAGFALHATRTGTRPIHVYRWSPS